MIRLTLGSSDNVHSYDYEHALDGTNGDYIASRHAVRVGEEDAQVSSCILLAGGGATAVHKQSAIIQNETCIVAVGPFMASLRIPTLELQWATQTDFATCFGVYRSDRHLCLISHGELEIARVSLDGKLVWQSSGADIFTNGFTLHEDYVHVLDWNNTEYAFDIETGRKYPA